MAETPHAKYFTKHIPTPVTRSELQKRYDDLKQSGLTAAAKSVAEQLSRMPK